MVRKVKVEKLWRSLTRKKTLSSDRDDTLLRRCLNLLDLSLLGVAIVVGGGIYLMVGRAIKNYTGPSICLSFLFAGVTTILSGLCYAEFSSYVKRAGSIYLYTYAVVGEILAFIIGWNTMGFYILAGAADSRALSGYIDSLVGGLISNHTMHVFGRIEVHGLAHYPDFVAFAVVIIAMAIVVVGVQASITVINVITAFSTALLVIITIINMIVADGFKTWTLDGGFFPNDFTGTMEGAAMVFFILGGIDCIPMVSEEAVEPTKSVPKALMVTTIFSTLLFILCSTSITLVIPPSDLDVHSPYGSALEAKGLTWSVYLIAAGTITAVLTTVISVVFTLARLPYSMACDGLLFNCFTYVTTKTKVPLVSLLVCGGMSAVISLIVDVELLMFGMSSVILLNYTVVAICIVYIRYVPSASPYGTYEEIPDFQENENKNDEAVPLLTKSSKEEAKTEEELTGKLRQKFHFLYLLADLPPGKAVKSALVGFIVSSLCLVILLLLGNDFAVWWMTILLITFSVAVLLCLFFISVHHQRTPKTFKVPLVPLLPCLSIFCMLALMVHLSLNSWLSLFIWIVLGGILYFAYGFKHSKERQAEVLDTGTVYVTHKKQTDSQNIEETSPVNTEIVVPQKQILDES